MPIYSVMIHTRIEQNRRHIYCLTSTEILSTLLVTSQIHQSVLRTRLVIVGITILIAQMNVTRQITWSRDIYVKRATILNQNNENQPSIHFSNNDNLQWRILT